MGQHDAFRHAGGSGGEHDHGRVIVTGFRKVYLLRIALTLQLVVGQMPFRTAFNRSVGRLSIQKNYSIRRQIS